MSPATATAEPRGRTHATSAPDAAPFPAAAAALLGAPGIPDLNAVLAGVPADAATRAIAAVPDFGALLTGPAPPLPPSVQAAAGPAVGADLNALALRADAAVDEILRIAGIDGLVVGRTLLLPGERATIDTQDGARLLLSAVQQALDGVTGPIETTGPMVDPTLDQPPPGVETTPAPPEAPIAVPDVPPPEAVAAEGAPAEAASSAVAGGEAAGPEAAAAGGEVAAPDAAAAGGEGGVPAEGEAAPPGGGAVVELIMPPAPTEPGPEQQARQAKVGGAARGAAGAATALPSAEQTTAAARGAVVEPPEETAARAQGALAAALGERPPPSPEIVALCLKIKTAIETRRPVDEDALRATDPAKAASDVGAGLNSSIDAEAGKAKAGYEPLGSPPAGAPALTPQAIPTPPTAVGDPGIAATRATPDAIPAENLSLDADKAAADQKVADANIERPTTEPIQTPPFSTVREGRSELDELATNQTAAVAAKQAEALGRAQLGMADLQTKALKALQTSRAGTVTKVAGGQQTAKGSEEQQRAVASAEAKALFEATRTEVMELVNPLTQTAMTRWDAGVAILSTAFKNHLAKVKGWVDERHKGAIGSLVGVWDDWTGLPDWITDEYTKAETAFGDGVCDLLTEISRDVNAVVAAAQARITRGREEIKKVFSDLPVSLQEWAAGEQEKFSGQLDALNQQVEDTRAGFIKEVGTKAITAVAEVQAEVEKLREAAKGKLAKIYDAINAFLEDPVKAIIEGLLLILGIPPPAFWALVARIAQVIADIANDPVGFLNNLVDAVKQGFQQFFDNFGSHVIDGFWKWLFQGLTKLGVTIPTDVSISSLIKLALEVMGISWPRIRGVLVKHIGEQNVVLIEHAWTIISTLVQKGPEGIVELLKEQLDPAKLIDQIISAAVDYLVETLIKKVALRIIGMLNPAGAILQAIELIYTVLMWIFRNAARIFRLIEAVVGGIADIIAGNIGGAAGVVEKALASMIPPVIDFLAELLGLGDLPWKIADIVKQLQAYVLEIVDTVIGFLVSKAKALLGVGDDKGEGDTELGKEVKFSGGGESHRQWIDASGTPMMASTTETVALRLKTWKDEAKAKFKDDADKLGKATALIDAAQAKLQEVITQAATLAKAYQSGKPDEKPPSDDELEAAQTELASRLSQVYEALGGKKLEEYLKDIKANLPTHGQERAAFLLSGWDERREGFRIGNLVSDPQLWPASPFVGVVSAGVDVTEKESEQKQLLPWFTTAPSEQRGAEAQAFGEYALRQESAPHSVRRTFTVALGGRAAQKLQESARQNIAAATHVDQDYKTRLLGKVDLIAFTWTPGGGTWTLPTERLPDHGRYAPRDLTISPDGRIVKYTTVTGQAYTVTLDPATALTKSIRQKGLRLRMALPGERGVTERSPGWASNMGFNAAHLIADRFGGSGWVAGLNLATTSARYNQVEMKAIEDRIALIVQAHADNPKLQSGEITFDLEVSVTTEALPTGTVLNAIKTQPEFEAGDHFDAQITQKIIDGEIVPELRRVTSVKYTLFLDNAEVFTDALGPDVDLLKGG